MDVCQGTINYVFSSRCFAFLREAGFVITQQSSTPSTKTYSVCLQTENDPFYVHYEQIIDEVVFEQEHNGRAIGTLSPRFIHANRNSSKDVVSPYFLENILIEDTPSTIDLKSSVPFGNKILLKNYQDNSLFHQMWYRKKFPFWAIVIHKTQPVVPDCFKGLPKVEFNSKSYFWFQNETTAWDLLISDSV